MFSPMDVTVGAGEWTVIELVNKDDVVRDWMVDGVRTWTSSRGRARPPACGSC